MPTENLILLRAYARVTLPRLLRFVPGGVQRQENPGYYLGRSDLCRITLVSVLPCRLTRFQPFDFLDFRQRFLFEMPSFSGKDNKYFDHRFFTRGSKMSHGFDSSRQYYAHGV